MSDFLAYTVLGVCLGSIYAIAAAGLIVTYTTSGIFNFAHGAVGMLSAIFYWQLHSEQGGWGMNSLLAAIITVVVFAPLVGALLEILVIRGLEGTSEITKLVTPVAMLLALNGIATWIWFRDINTPHVPESFFGLDGAKVFGQFVSYHQMIGVGLSILVAGFLYVLLRKTRLGVTMRATVDDRSLLMLNGGSPTRMSLAAWAIGSGLAGLAGVLLSPQLGNLTVFALTLLVFDAYPSALAGRLRSVPLAYAGAIAIGLVVNYWQWISEAGTKWVAFKTLSSALPALLLFVVLLLLPQDRLRGTVITRTREHFRVPSMRQSFLWGGVMIVTVLMLQALMVNSAVITLSNGIALGLISISLVLLTGYAGEINLAAYTFAGIATIVAWQFDVGPNGNATQTSLSLGAIVLATLVCAAVGALIALPALRLRGLYLGLATFAFAVVVDVMVIRQAAPIDVNLFGWKFQLNFFTNGSLTVPRPNWFGIDFVKSQRNFLMLMTVLFVVIGIGLIALRRSAFGRMIVAMRDSPAACATLGLNIVQLKLAVFTLSSAIAGLGGLMWAAQQRNLTNQGTFQVFASLTLFMIAVVGGIGYVSGALLAGIFLSVLGVVMPEIFKKLGTDYPSLHWLFETGLGNFTKFVGPALVGIGLGKNPSGIANQIMEGFAVLKKATTGVAIWIGIELVLWFLAWREIIGNWTFAIITIVLANIAPRIIISIWHHKVKDDLPESGLEDDDLVGLSRPFNASDRDRYDAILGITQQGAR